MSDKSFGDHINRNVVKNSLLSSAVIGLSLEDLTHKAVLLPASPSQGQVTRLDQQQEIQAHTLAHSDHDKPSFPSGDAFTSVSLSSTPSSVPPSKLVSENNEKTASSRGNTTAMQSKASVKDDFDVNEYIARLQGTRYVSAPLHSHLKDPDANLGEEALEEINLNDSRAEPVQSLTADIAQNFSQLPTVLPHMASAVFSSFSNMLMKSREQTPDKYQEVQFDRPDTGVPLMGVEENTQKDFGLPPKEPPLTGAGNYRITSKKKYAQIPGLSYGGTHNVYQNPNTFPSNRQTPNILEGNTANDTKDNDVKQNTPLFTPADNTAFQTVDMFGSDVDKAQSAMHINVPGIDIASCNDQKNQPNISQESQFAPTDHKDITTPRIPIIPPPPMFSNLRSNQATAKSVLPPSVARRISANQPLIKPSMPAPVFSDNIFVPTIPESNSQFFETVQPHLPSAMAQKSSVPLYSPPEKPTLPVGASFFSPPKTESSTVGFYTPLETSSEASFAPSNSVSQGFGVGDNVPPSIQPLTSIGAPPTIGANIYSPESVPDSNATSSVSQPSNTTPFVPMFTQPSQAPNIEPSMTSIGAPPIGANIYPFESLPAPASSLMSQPSNTTPFVPMFTPSQAPNVQPPFTSIGEPAFGTNMSSSENIPASTPYSMPQPSNTTPFVPMFAPTQATPFFNPQTKDPITQIPPGVTPEPKPIVEPPKATGMNFRMTKKRPQYYSGPIEGVGAISNNVKPIIAPVIPVPSNPSAFQGSFFTPEQQESVQLTSPIEQGSLPFDISKPVQPVANQFEIKPQGFDMNPQQYSQEYNTAFDLSRTTEAYEPPKQEPKGFGIIGSLKSKLSSIDMNKIQSTVTTFFDPAYNVAKGEPALETAPYAQQKYGQYSQEQSNFEVTVSGVDQNQYSQFRQQQYSYDQSNQYYQAQKTYNYQNDGQNASNYFNEANTSQQVYTPALNTNSQEYARGSTNYTQENIPQNVANISDNTASKETQEISFYNPAAVQEQQVNVVNYPQPSFDKPKPDIAAYISPNVGTHGAIGDLAVKAIPPIGTKQGFKHFADLTPQAASFFDNSLIGADYTKPYNKMTANEALQSRIQFNAPLPPAMSLFGNPSTSAESRAKKIELVAELEKLAMAEEIAIARSPLQEIDLKIGAGVSSTAAKTGDRNITAIALDKNVQNFHINKEDVKPDLKTISLMESLSKDITPVVAVASVPLFGLSAVIDKSQEPIKKVENVCLYEASKEIKPILESTSFSLFKNTAAEDKVHEEPSIPLSLSMADVKNVLLMEPPQENLGAILKQTASSNLIKDLPEAEVKNIQNLSENRDSSWNLDANMVTSKDNVNLLFDRKASGFFDHLMPTDNSVYETVQKDTDATEQASNFNICETCREVTSPEIKETDNVTNKLIENMNSSIQLSNPVETILTESIPAASDRAFEEKQFDDINRITEDTIETLQGQSAAELLDNAASNNNYGWNTEQLAYATIAAIDKEFATNTAVDPNYNSPMNPEYTFKIDPNAIGFFGDNSVFFDNVPKNASDEIKAEFKTHEDVPPQQITLPSAPPAEDDTKSDETGVLDVLSIEQDAKKDFPLEEEFIIEPDTDDDKIEFRERKKSSEDSALDTFTDRIEKFKNKTGSEFSSSDDIYQKPTGFVPHKMPSYFDTGNYAVETHFRKSLTSPTNINIFQAQLPTNVNIIQEQVTNVKETVYPVQDMGSYVSEDVFRLPPGFEDEIRRQLLGQTSSDDNKEPFIPETSTQTRPTVTTTYNVAAAKEFYTTAGFEDIKPVLLQTKTDAELKQSETYEAPLEKAFGSTNTLIKDHTQAFSAQVKPNPEPAQNKLPDPINFFSQNENKDTPEAPESFNRLASYFSMPPAQPDHSKSFFELSQSQNHYRHVVSENNDSGQGYSKTQQNLLNLLQDLTSTQNINNSNDIVRTVNYFSVYENANIPKLDNLNLNTNNEIKHIDHLDSIQFKDEVDSTINGVSETFENIEKDEINTISTCKYCCNTKLKDVKDYKLRTAADSDRKEKDGNMSEKDSSKQSKSVSVDLGHSGLDEEAQDGVIVQEGRSSSEYTPVRHHWFYRVDVDDKSLWRGFSTTDSNALEHKYTSPDLTEDTLVPTDGGRFDVNIVGRLRLAVYWKEKPTNVRRNHGVSPLHQLLLTLRFYALGTMLISVADFVGVSISTAGRIVRDISVTIANLYEEYVTVHQQSAEKFYRIAGFPRVLAAIDCTHIRIQSPCHVIGEEFRNRKGYFSLNVQAICDADLRFMNVVARWPGSTHDATIFNNSILRAQCDAGQFGNRWMLGDSAYPNRPYLLTPLLNPATEAEQRYNEAHIKTRNTIERCSWFYKGTTDARYVPYTEAVADKLEEEYRHGVTTGEWHRRLVLPNSELVVMHGPAVMVHFLHAGADSFSAPPFLLGKKVYRNPPKIHVPRDLRPPIDHLIFVVHGAGEYKKESNDDSTSRPRVVRRGYEESEIEDPEPSSIDHLLLLCHGVGSACDMRFRPVEEVVEDFRSTSLQLLQSHYRNSYDNGIVSRVEVLPISWHAQLHVGEGGVDKRLNKVTLESIPRLRAFTNHTVLDALFYTSPVYHQTIIDTVCSELNRIYNLFKERNPNFKGGVSLGGHSLGSVILYDLLCHQTPEKPIQPKSSSQKTYLPGTMQPLEKYPSLQFFPAALYALGSPIAIFECIRGVEALGMDFALPTCKNFFNIFHPYDPIAYRIEPLINPLLQDAKPFLIPHHKGRKRMHLELKETMVRVGADLKQKLIESLRTTWNKWKATPPPDGQLEKVVEEEMEKEQLCEETKEEQVDPELGGAETLGNLNSGRRVDYVLQEAPLEMINEYLFAMSSHVGYWESEDTMLLMLREIYSSLGVQPDSTVPQQSMTVTRTTTLDEATIVNEKEYPSTSRGSSS